jgi:hypothetical protein
MAGAIFLVVYHIGQRLFGFCCECSLQPYFTFLIWLLCVCLRGLSLKLLRTIRDQNTDIDCLQVAIAG